MGIRARASSRGLSLTILVVGMLAAPLAARSTIILETAVLGTTGQTTGTAINSAQMLGARFSITQSTQITAVGGHLVANVAGGIFAAIVSLSSPSALPSFLPTAIATSALVGTAFTPPATSADVLTPLSVLLAPGNYALIFGSAAFGATGTGRMPVPNLLLGTPSFFRSSAGTWVNGGFTNTRFVVLGNVVPEPTTALLLGIGLAGITGARRRQRAQ